MENHWRISCVTHMPPMCITRVPLRSGDVQHVHIRGCLSHAQVSHVSCVCSAAAQDTGIACVQTSACVCAQAEVKAKMEEHSRALEHFCFSWEGRCCWLTLRKKLSLGYAVWGPLGFFKKKKHIAHSAMNIPSHLGTEAGTPAAQKAEEALSRSGAPCHRKGIAAALLPCCICWGDW